VAQSATFARRVVRAQTWLNWAFPLSFFVIAVIDIVGHRLSIPSAYYIPLSWFLVAVIWVLIGSGWGYIICRYPQQLVGPTKSAVDRTGMPRLYALATVWAYAWGGVFWVILGLSTLNETSIWIAACVMVALVAFLP
jgi:hypothetical protein